MRPFLKWLGNKYRLVDAISKKLPAGARLIEPFVGSGAVFLNTNYPKYIISECNKDVVAIYRFLKKDKHHFINFVSSFFNNKFNSKKEYYKIRSLFNQTDDKHLRAALFIYLNRHGYNGLCRYNNAGKYNVPFGYYAKPYFPSKEMLFFSTKLKHAIIKCGDYKQAMQLAKVGDVIYCDPPYVPLSATANFTQYYGETFGQDDQFELVKQAKICANNGVPVLISNHSTSLTKKMYANSQISYLKVRRMISCKAHKREFVSEILALFS